MASLAFIIGSYFLGTLPQVYWITKARGGASCLNGDLHEALWGLSRPLGVAGFVIDLIKGMVPVLVGRWLGFPVWVVATGGVMVVLGQMWPVYLLRSGGGGNSTSASMSATLAIRPLLMVLVIVIAGLAWRVISHIRKGQPAFGPPHSRSLPLSALIASVFLPVASWLLGEPLPVTLAFVGIFVAIVAKRVTKGIAVEAATGRIRGRAVLEHLVFD